MNNSKHPIIAKINKNDTKVISSSGLEIPLSSASKNQEGASAGELLAMSLAACLSSTLKIVLAAHQKDIDYEIEVHHSSEREDNKHEGFYFTLDAHITLYNLSESLSEKYVGLTKKLCPVSKALKDHAYYQTFIHNK
jgi:uncharacterized OsmC-like protein